MIDKYAEAMEPLDKTDALSQVVAGKSFVDIGGLWGTKGEMVTRMMKAGAKSATMADMQDENSPLWPAFDKHCEQMGVSGYGKKIVNICAPDAPQQLGKFDVVHCTGVMYHVPDVLQFLGNLTAVTGEYLFLGSSTLPPRIKNAEGMLETAPDQAVFIPNLTQRTRRIIVAYYEEIYGRMDAPFNAGGLTNDAPFFDAEGRPNFGPWWWLFTGGFMMRALSAHGFDIVAHGPNPMRFGYLMLARRR
ncbi:MAG: hypothetical protein AAF281_05310 [Pseudomonadota bacterium]